MAIQSIRTFNTGRHYSEHGQRIAWEITGAIVNNTDQIYQVAFVDVDRQIDGMVEVWGEPTDDKVLTQYDKPRGYQPFRFGPMDKGRYERLALQAGNL